MQLRNFSFNYAWLDLSEPENPTGLEPFSKPKLDNELIWKPEPSPKSNIAQNCMKKGYF